MEEISEALVSERFNYELYGMRAAPLKEELLKLNFASFLYIINTENIPNVRELISKHASKYHIEAFSMKDYLFKLVNEVVLEDLSYYHIISLNEGILFEGCEKVLRLKEAIKRALKKRSPSLINYFLSLSSNTEDQAYCLKKSMKHAINIISLNINLEGAYEHFFPPAYIEGYRGSGEEHGGHPSFYYGLIDIEFGTEPQWRRWNRLVFLIKSFKEKGYLNYKSYLNVLAYLSCKMKDYGNVLCFMSEITREKKELSIAALKSSNYLLLESLISHREFDSEALKLYRPKNLESLNLLLEKGYLGSSQYYPLMAKFMERSRNLEGFYKIINESPEALLPFHFKTALFRKILENSH